MYALSLVRILQDVECWGFLVGRGASKACKAEANLRRGSVGPNPVLAMDDVHVVSTSTKSHARYIYITSTETYMYVQVCMYKYVCTSMYVQVCIYMYVYSEQIDGNETLCATIKTSVNYSRQLTPFFFACTVAQSTCNTNVNCSSFNPSMQWLRNGCMLQCYLYGNENYEMTAPFYLTFSRDVTTRSALRDRKMIPTVGPFTSLHT
jgi:hypothetical protein